MQDYYGITEDEYLFYTKEMRSMNTTITVKNKITYKNNIIKATKGTNPLSKCLDSMYSYRFFDFVSVSVD